MSSFDPADQRSRAEPFQPFVGTELTSERTTSSVFVELAGRELQGREAEAQERERARAEAEAAAREAEIAAAVERGRAQGAEAVHAEFGDAAAGFRAALESLAASRGEMREHYERELLGVAVQVAEKILVNELTADPTQWLGMIREAVGRILDRDSIRIRLGRALYHFLAPREGELAMILEDVRELELIEDSSLESTGCVIETTYSDLELSLSRQLEALANRLMDRE